MGILRSNLSYTEKCAAWTSLSDKCVSDFLSQCLNNDDFEALRALIESGRAFDVNAQANVASISMKRSPFFERRLFITVLIYNHLCLTSPKDNLIVKHPLKNAPNHAFVATVNRSPDQALGTIVKQLIDGQRRAFKDLKDPVIENALDYMAYCFGVMFKDRSFFDLARKNDGHISTEKIGRITQKIKDYGALCILDALPPGVFSQQSISAFLENATCKAVVNPSNIWELVIATTEPAQLHKDGPLYSASNEDSAQRFLQMHQHLSTHKFLPSLAEITRDHPRLFELHHQDLIHPSQPIHTLIGQWVKSGVLHLLDSKVQRYVGESIVIDPSGHVTPPSAIHHAYAHGPDWSFDVLDNEASLLAALRYAKRPNELIHAKTIYEGSQRYELPVCAAMSGHHQLLEFFFVNGMDIEHLQKQCIDASMSSQQIDAAIGRLRALDAKKIAKDITDELRMLKAIIDQ